jgi:hypothetical protein
MNVETGAPLSLDLPAVTSLNTPSKKIVGRQFFLETKTMGMWAYAPWDNDSAADWYGDLMDRTNLRDVWLEGISEDPEESPDVVRAAAALFLMLGRVYVWPIKAYDDDLEKTIASLTRVAACPEYKESPELVEVIEQELQELKSRRKQDKAPTPDQPQQKPWWKFWS